MSAMAKIFDESDSKKIMLMSAKYNTIVSQLLNNIYLVDNTNCSNPAMTPTKKISSSKKFSERVDMTSTRVKINFHNFFADTFSRGTFFWSVPPPLFLCSLFRPIKHRLISVVDWCLNGACETKMSRRGTKMSLVSQNCL